MNNLDKARQQSEKIKSQLLDVRKKESEIVEDVEQKDLVIAQAKHIKDLYGENFKNAGTEEMDQSDLNTPWLILMQSNTDIEGRIPGSYYRSDTKEMMESVSVNFVYVTNKVKNNEKKNIDEQYKEYYGFFQGTNEPFRMKMKGWGMGAHKELQTEIAVYKTKFNIPMFALTVELTSERKEGQTKEGKEYKIYKIVCSLLKDGQLPVIEENPDRIGFLLEAVERFKKISPIEIEEEQS